MAERRMFAKTIIDSDAFLDMPLSSQVLYFHLSMRADDEGFINNPRKIQRMIGCGNDDMSLLIAKKFLLEFDSGVVVIKHWRIHNYIQKDRFKSTLYTDEKNQLIQDENKSYTFGKTASNQQKEECIQNGYSLETQVRLGKDRLGKDRLVIDIADVIDFYEKNGFGMISPKTREDISYWISDFEKIGATTEDACNIIIYAMTIAIENNVRKYTYFNAILKDWENHKLVTVDQVKAKQNEFRNNGKSKEDEEHESYEGW